jgi:hypothetical protein
VIVDMPIARVPQLVAIDLVPPVDRSDIELRRTSGLVSLSIPVVNPLDLRLLNESSPQVAEYIRQKAPVYEGKVLTFACSFVSDPEPLVRAVIAVSLICGDSTMREGPIAWCLEPRHITKSAPTRPMKLSFDLTLPPKAAMELGDERRVEENKYVMLAYGEGTSSPEWLFRRTRHNNFDGIHWLGMVVLVPREEPSVARIALTAAVQHRKWGVIRYTARLPEQISRVTLS